MSHKISTNNHTCPYSSTVLKSVQKPGRYSGGEFGQPVKDKSRIKARFAFCFPDSYEIVQWYTPR